MYRCPRVFFLLQNFDVLVVNLKYTHIYNFFFNKNYSPFLFEWYQMVDSDLKIKIYQLVNKVIVLCACLKDYLILFIERKIALNLI